MSVLFLVFLFLGVSLASEQSEPFKLSVLKQRVISWAKQEADAVLAEIRETTSRLEQFVTMSSSPNVQKLAQLHQENRHFLHKCDFTSELQGFNSCVNVTDDIANMTLVAIDMYQVGVDLVGSFGTDITDLDACSTKPVWKQFSCYKVAFDEFELDLKTYSVECNQLISNTTEVLKDIEDDLKKCFSYSEKYSTEWVESKIKACKLALDG